MEYIIFKISITRYHTIHYIYHKLFGLDELAITYLHITLQTNY